MLRRALPCAARALRGAALPAGAAPRELAASAASAAPRNRVEDEPYSRARRVMPLGSHWPIVASDAWVAPNATVVGAVKLDDYSSVWYGAVVRGDLAQVRLGAWSNVQERAVVGTARSVPTGMSPNTSIGHHVSIGAGSVLRSVTIENEVVIGIKCVLMEGVVVESGAVLADNTVVPPARRIPGKQLWAGNPAHYVRDLTYDELHEIPHLAKTLSDQASLHGDQLLPHPDLNMYNEAIKLRAALAAAPPS